MTHLIFVHLLFLIAGAKNGSYYAGRSYDNLNYLLLLWILLGGYVLYYDQTWLVIPIAGVMWWQGLIFTRGLNKQIHTGEYVLGAVMRGSMWICGTDIWMLILTSYSTDTLFKAPINLYIGRKWVERVDGTDDPSGRTVNFYLFGREFKVPRIANGHIRLMLGIIGILAWLLLYQLGI